jgi:hypothetical protein
MTWLGLFIFGVKRPELHSDIRAKNHKPLIWIEKLAKTANRRFVAEQK